MPATSPQRNIELVPESNNKLIPKMQSVPTSPTQMLFVSDTALVLASALRNALRADTSAANPKRTWPALPTASFD